MNSSKINNIVFFKSNGVSKACVFYKDGTVKELSNKEGISLIKKIANNNGINTTNEFKKVFANMVNKNLVHVVSEKEFRKNFESYKPVVKTEKKTIKKVEEPIKVEKEDTTKNVEQVVVASDSTSINSINAEKEFKPVKAKNIGLINDKKNKKKKPFKVRIAAAALAAIVGLTGTAFGLSKISKSGVMSKSNFKSITRLASNESEDLVKDNNDYYDSYTYEELLQVTKNKTQKAEMKRIHDALYGYNIDFANNYIEEDKDIKAALTFREVVALSQAYNDFTPAQIKAIFNGTAIKAAELDSAYKTATLQLMGAHVIENREHPVDMSGIIVSEEGKEFYNKYHNLFLSAKEATGDEKIEAVEAFYAEVRKDFPIDPDTREVGISHSSSHQVVESYMLSITPMVAAGEIMWQNLDIDKTLQGGVSAYFLGTVDVNELSKEELVELILNGNGGVSKGEIDYFNDLGLCNIAEDKFEIVQQITMGAVGNSDKTNPRFDQYENAMVKELTDMDAYVIDDAHRELSELDSFQDAVNWHFELDEDGYYTGSVYYTTETHTRTRTWKKTKTTKKTVVTRTKKEIPDDEKEKIDKQIKEENEQEKKKQEEKAEENRKEMQEEEDKKAEEIKKEVEEDEKDLQDKIEDANEKIEHNQEIDKQIENGETPVEDKTPVNEKDFGDHNVTFDDEHKDDQGNLNDSVEHITTDDSDVKTPSDLPDPNETGKKFDEEGEKQAPKTEAPKTEAPKTEAPKTEAPKAEAPKTEAPKAEAPKTEAPKAEAPKSNEQIVNEYVEKEASSSDEEEKAKELQK